MGDPPTTVDGPAEAAPRTQRRRRWRLVASASVGLLAAAVGLGLGHLVAGLVDPAASPWNAVGSNVIDLTPTSIKTWAIRRFGTKDKLVLLSTVAVVTAVLAVVAGIAGRRRRRLGAGLFVVLGVVAVLAALRAPAASAASVPGGRVLPGLVAGLAATGAFLWLTRLLAAPAAARPATAGDDHAAAGPTGEHVAPAVAVERPTDHHPEAPEAGTDGRRRFLGTAAALAGTATVSGLIGQRLARPAPVPDLPDLARASTAPALPTDLARKVDGISPLRTASRDFYRVDTALVLPRVDVGSWRLKAEGMVDQPFELSYDDLLRLPLIERDITLTCVSNEVGGPYISSGRWLGVRTRDLLERAGVQRGVDQILSRSVEGMTISTPIEALMDDRDAMVVVGLNGETLPRRNGFPARLLTPGLYGFVGATKWLTSMKATTYADDRAYWTRRDWATDAPILTESRIDTPKSFAKITPGPAVIGGVAWAQGRGIKKVEVRIDDGPWQEATLGAEANIAYWRQWYLPWDATEPGRHDLVVRATDGTGAVQTDERATPFPKGATGLHSVVVNVG